MPEVYWILIGSALDNCDILARNAASVTRSAPATSSVQSEVPMNTTSRKPGASGLTWLAMAT
ncbi:Uncharacterised protein [Mycobacteroides abscessus subsp. abscessus]|nr:Uncharacterised protein [Mycobacteroides abscessus subsp. abscessus]SKV70695.1 Uncharacterised protein [Mycobacteroides abscessus subsp. abscessus]